VSLRRVDEQAQETPTARAGPGVCRDTLLLVRPAAYGEGHPASSRGELTNCRKRGIGSAVVRLTGLDQSAWQRGNKDTAKWRDGR
jgi:hypothetical protein